MNFPILHGCHSNQKRPMVCGLQSRRRRQSRGERQIKTINALRVAVYLQPKTVDAKVAERLFGAMRSLATFCQRIAVAFGFIDKKLYRNIELIRKIRNYFAHRPLERSFEWDQVKGKVLTVHIRRLTCKL